MDNNVKQVKDLKLLALKIIAEAFLLSKGNNKTKEMFPKKIDINSAELSDGEMYVLHHWLIEQYARVGLDLNKLIEATGEQVVPGKLSQFEIKELANRAEEVVLMMSVFKDYIQAKNN